MTDFYDADHNISDIDRARSEAVQAGRADPAGRFDQMMAMLEEEMRRVMDGLLEGGEAAAAAADKAVATSTKFLEELPEYEPSPEDLAEELKCPVCLQCVAEGDTMHVLPCAHAFHPECVVPWLKKHNTCPVCRHELPSDDPAWAARQEAQRAEKDRANDLEQLHNAMFG
mmetsp:Transcript_15463/g.40007  ORF Transcript_15463/g.40007 Transcript_15463/m.40007 type:complete len:170 (-) Transcript_15463:506-1015(-)